MRMFNVMAVFCILLMAGAAFGATINEIRIDQPSTDNDEYFELAGTPGESLDGLWFLSVGDGTGGSGVIETAVDLTGYVIQPDGVFAMGETSFSNTCGSIDATGTLNFENSDNLTFLLVTDFTGSAGDDIDVAEDGVIDNVLWTAIIDDVAFVENTDVPTFGEYYYSANVVGPDGTYVPGHAAFCGGMWQILDFDLCTITETIGEPSDEFCDPVANDAATFGSLRAQ